MGIRCCLDGIVLMDINREIPRDDERGPQFEV